MHRNLKTNDRNIRNIQDKVSLNSQTFSSRVIEKANSVDNKYSKIFLGSEKMLLNSEKMLLNLLCYDKSVFDKLGELIKPEDFSEGLHRRVAIEIFNYRRDEQHFEPGILMSKFEGIDIEHISSILHTEIYYDDNYKAAIQLVNVINRHKKIVNEVKLCIEEGNVEKLNILITELKKI
jgi:hypothetical protein